jgi:plasmid stability protein
MASITIRKLDDFIKTKLRVRAAHNNRSMEDEARYILRAALAEDVKTSGNLAEAIHGRFKPLGGLDLQLPDREPVRQPPIPQKR